LHETKDHLAEALKCKYLTPQDHLCLKRLCLRAIKANNRLIAYLLHSKAPEPFWRLHPKNTERLEGDRNRESGSRTGRVNRRHRQNLQNPENPENPENPI